MVTVRWVDCRTIPGFWFKRTCSCKDRSDAWLFAFVDLFFCFYFFFLLSSFGMQLSLQLWRGRKIIYKRHDLPFRWGLMLTCIALAESGDNHALVVFPWLLVCSCIGMKMLCSSKRLDFKGRCLEVCGRATFISTSRESILLSCSRRRKEEQSSASTELGEKQPYIRSHV